MSPSLMRRFGVGLQEGLADLLMPLATALSDDL
jgi:hypothetical protein